MPRSHRSLLAVLAAAVLLTTGAAAASPGNPFVRHAAPVTASPPGAETSGAPFVLVDGADRLLVVWRESVAPFDLPAWRAQRFGADGVPVSAVTSLGGSGVAEPLVGWVSDVAMSPDGRWAVIWTDGEAVLLRRFTPEGAPEGPAVRIDAGEVPAGSERLAIERQALALAADGSGMALWEQRLFVPDVGFEVRRLLSRRFAADGQPVGEEVEREVWVDDGVAFRGGFDAAFNPAGEVLLASERQSGDPSFGHLTATLLAADGSPVPLDPAAAELHPSEHGPRVAAAGDGSFALAFTGGAGQGPDGRDGSCTGAFVRFWAADGEALAPERRVHPETLGCQGLVDVAGLAGGGWLVAWTGALADPFWGTDASRQGLFLTTYDAGGDPVGEPVRLVVPSFMISAEPDLAAGATIAAVAEQRFLRGVRLHLVRAAGEAVCPPPAPGGPLCLGGERWRVDVAWQDPYNGGPIGDSHPLPLVAETGALWFFRPDNLELMIKVLDARPVNGHWWVFYGALTTVESWIDVTDLEAGRQRSYYNPPFLQASRADTAAFDDLAPAAGEGSVAAPAAVATPEPSRPPAAGVDLVPPGRPARSGSAPAEETAACADGADRLCLHQRFLVEVDWENPRDGGSGEGRAFPVNPGTGAFWFFAPSNLELLVKVIDGRAANGHWWVFHGGLSDVEYTLTVTDTLLGGSVTYRSPPFELTGGADTAAFPEPPPQP